MKRTCIDTDSKRIAADAADAVQPSTTACVEKSHLYAASTLRVDTSGVQTGPEQPTECTDAIPTRSIWDTVSKAYRRISMLPEPAGGEAGGSESILQTWVDTVAASHQFYGD